MLQTFILTKNFPLKHSAIKKKPRLEKNNTNARSAPSKHYYLICNPEKCLQLVSHYSFSGGLLIYDHLSTEKENNYLGYFKILNECKKITSLSINDEFQMLEINMRDQHSELTPFEFFEDRMKSLGNKDSVQFCEIIRNILGFFQENKENKALGNGDETNSLLLESQIENYKKFKLQVKRKLQELSSRNEYFLAILMRSDPDNPSKMQDAQHCISQALLQAIYGSNTNYLFDIMREGVHDFYGFEGDYYVNTCNMFRKMFFNDPVFVDVVLRDVNGNRMKAKVECEIFGFQAHGYQEYVSFHTIKIYGQANKAIKGEESKSLEKNPENFANNKSKNEEICKDYHYFIEKFKNKFYPERVPLNEREENQAKVCGFKSIK